MKLDLVLTLIGEDRPGLVESLALAIANNSGNWLDSSMSKMAGKFAGILRIRIAEESIPALEKDLQALSGRLKINLERTVAESDQLEMQALNLKLVGNDRPGIVREISRVLASHGINVEKFTSQCAPAPMSSEPLFTAIAELRIPGSLKIDTLQEELEKLADDLIVDIAID